MSVSGRTAQPAEQTLDKGLKSGALGLISTTVIATASVAPAYSLAATLASSSCGSWRRPSSRSRP